MDLEMDIDMEMDVSTEETTAMDAEVLLFAPAMPDSGPSPSSDPDVAQPTPHKVHLRGLDNLTTDDIKSFAAEYFGEESMSRVEWVNDHSANIVYATPATAQKALAAFAAVEIPHRADLPLLQTFSAKPFPLHPETQLEVRLAVLGDRKQAGARDRSRFYLLNPDHDPAERKKKEGGGRRGSRTYRDRDDGGYRSQKYDDYEDRRRRDKNSFDMNLYDDDEPTLLTRRKEDREPRYSERKELFPHREIRAGSGRLRDRSASPTRSDDDELVERSVTKDRDNRTKARELKNAFGKPNSATAIELFPEKRDHRLSSAFDSADETANLFASRMHVPFFDGASDMKSKDRSLASRITSTRLDDRVLAPYSESTDGISIKGTAKSQSSSGFTIKGSSSASTAKELFPGRLGAGNSGKELFAERLEGRGGRRRKAEDMFG